MGGEKRREQLKRENKRTQNGSDDENERGDTRCC